MVRGGSFFCFIRLPDHRNIAGHAKRSKLLVFLLCAPRVENLSALPFVGVFVLCGRSSPGPPLWALAGAPRFAPDVVLDASFELAVRVWARRRTAFAPMVAVHRGAVLLDLAPGRFIGPARLD